MNVETPEELEIVLARRVNPRLVRELRVSLTEGEFMCLADVIRRAATESEFYEKLLENPTQVLKETYGKELSDEAIKALEEIKDDLGDWPTPRPLI